MSDDIPAVEDGLSYDEETDVYRATFDSATTQPSVAVVTAIAHLTDTEPTQLAPLHDVVDATALDNFFSKSATDHVPAEPSIEFTYIDYSVRIDSYGLIEVWPAGDDESHTD